MNRRLIAAAAVLGGALCVVGPCLAQSDSASPYRLSLKQAIERGLKENLNVRTAGAAVEEATGEAGRRQAALFPTAQAALPVTLQSRDLHAFGISFPGVPEVVGPFGTVDFRVYFSQQIVNLQRYHSWKSSQAQEQAAQLDYQDTRDVIVETVAALYLNGEAAAARVQSAQSRADTAESLYQLAAKQHDAGVATGVDVLRAQVALASERQNLLEMKNAYQQALLALERSIGMEPGTPVDLTRTLRYEALTPPSAATGIAEALASRQDYRALQEQRRAVKEQEKANHSRYLPTLSIDGDYGGIGRNLNHIRATTDLSATLRFTLFDRDRAGERTEISSRMTELDARIEDLRRGVAQEVHSALLNLESASQAVQVAQQAKQLAVRELKLARDRFASGVTNNIEVITAQDALSRADENVTSALTQHEAAKVTLARALGGTEKTYEQYLGTQ